MQIKCWCRKKNKYWIKLWLRPVQNENLLLKKIVGLGPLLQLNLFVLTWLTNNKQTCRVVTASFTCNQFNMFIKNDVMFDSNMTKLTNFRAECRKIIDIIVNVLLINIFYFKKGYNSLYFPWKYFLSFLPSIKMFPLFTINSII